MQLNEYGSYQTLALCYYMIVYFLIISLSIFSILYYIFNTVLSLKAGDFKRNIHRINQAVYITCPISSVFVIIEKILDVIELKQDYEKNNEIYICFQYARTAILAPPFFSLIATMLERLCATYYIQDYEKKQRPWIGYILIAFLYASALFTEYIVDFKSEYFVTFSTVHLIINGISYGILLWTYRLNRSYYFENRVVKHTYSLGERYQISENIRIHKYFTRYLFVIAFFTSACGVIMISALLSPRSFQRMLIAMFDLSYILLTIFAPYCRIYKTDTSCLQTQYKN